MFSTTRKQSLNGAMAFVALLLVLTVLLGTGMILNAHAATSSGVQPASITTTITITDTSTSFKTSTATVTTTSTSTDTVTQTDTATVNTGTCTAESTSTFGPALVINGASTPATTTSTGPSTVTTTVTQTVVSTSTATVISTQYTCTPPTSAPNGVPQFSFPGLSALMLVALLLPAVLLMNKMRSGRRPA
ncbi:MAG: hypothetical protein OK449_06745 [Thaumarchaeota archaeon]|nr:hypothetical protein [Nitrososphaerota archaeon]